MNSVAHSPYVLVRLIPLLVHASHSISLLLFYVSLCYNGVNISGAFPFHEKTTGYSDAYERGERARKNESGERGSFGVGDEIGG